MRFVIIFSLIILAPLVSFAHDISGQIVDENQQGVSGAYIILLSTEYHTHTNEFGKFLLNDVKIGDTLQVMHLGYETKFLLIENSQEEMTIELKASNFELDEVVIGQNSKEVNVISVFDIELSPVKSSQEILRKVPGLFIGQHAGGGKAEQIFLRGFDIDHGTDIHITVDGLPVNMVSHAHGQGYADLHFVIPETIQKIDFGKGPYYANKGNFGTAGYVQFNTKEKLEYSEISMEVGRFNSFRSAGLFKLLDSEKNNAYIATEYQVSDGAFESSQNFSRRNFMGKFTSQLDGNGKLSLVASHFYSKWDASGQIPGRAVKDGSINRFGAIDDTEGGETSRSNLLLSFDRILDDNSFVKNRIYYSLYDFELFSNFTFFLNDPINGDQIRQKEERQIFGFESVLNRSSFLKNNNLLLQLGIGLRSDLIEGNELSRTKNRKDVLSRIQFGDVDEKNLYLFANAEFDVGKWLFEPSVRFDHFKFNYINNLDSLYANQSQSKSIVSPKFNIVYNLDNSMQLFLKSGVGFHSNDTRVVLQNNVESILPAAYGLDLGTILKPSKSTIMNISLWYLSSEQEFVYVGDEGIVEPSGSSRRVGVDVGLRYQVNDWIFANADFNYAFARSIDEPSDANLIPLAPISTATLGVNFKRNNFVGSIQSRFLQDRPATENNSIVAEGYLITDVNATYDFGKLSLGFSIENLFNQEWNETQFATESRLRNETNAVEEIHFTPGTPFFIKGVLKYKF